MRHSHPIHPRDPFRTAVRLRRVAATVATGALLAAALLAGPDGQPLAGGRLPLHASTRPAGGSDQLVLAAAHRTSHAWKGHPGRRIRPYRVHRGDTATGLAVRFHAWTDELLALNHLSPRSTLYVGERLRIPVVVAAVRRARAHARHHARHHVARHHTGRHARHHVSHHAKRRPTRHHRSHRTRHHGRGWVHADVSRADVRRVVILSARRQRVSANLALAIAWQESGWQQRQVSPAGAIGVMQVMPATGRWLSLELGHDLHLRDLHDNVKAGVVLLRYLRAEAGPRHAIAGYYQGLGSVRAHGFYPSTRAYVRSVVTIRRHLRAGWNPAS